MSHYHSKDAFEAFCKARAVALHEHICTQPADQFQGKPWVLVKEIEDFANAQKLPMIFRESKVQLAQAAFAEMDQKPKVLVEFGTFVGNSAIAWGATLKALHSENGNSVRVYSFELDPEYAAIARDLVRLAGVDDVVTVLEGAGAESLRALVAEGKIADHGVDAVFLDHWEEIYLNDLRVCEELKVLHKGSVILADNTDIPGAPEYLSYVQNGGSNQHGAVKYKSTTYEVPKSDNLSGPKVLEVSVVIEV